MKQQRLLLFTIGLNVIFGTIIITLLSGQRSQRQDNYQVIYTELQTHGETNGNSSQHQVLLATNLREEQVVEPSSQHEVLLPKNLREKPVVQTISPPHWTVFLNGTVVHVGNSPQKYNFSYLINSHQEICSNWTKDSNKLKLVMIIKSNVINFDRRQTIRETTGLRILQQQLNYRIVFLLGIEADYFSMKNDSETWKIQTKVHKESLEYGDIIQLDIIESFRNLTMKAIMSLDWYINFCSSADISLSTDDDIYIHAPNLMSQMSQFKSKGLVDRHITCNQNTWMPILREKNGKNKYTLTEDELPGKFFPQYCSGFGYAFGLDVAKKIYEQTFLTPYVFIDDAFITGFCRYKAEIDVVHNENFALNPSVTDKNTACQFKKGRITSNQFDFHQIINIWKYVNKIPRNCTEKS